MQRYRGGIIILSVKHSTSLERLHCHCFADELQMKWLAHRVHLPLKIRRCSLDETLGAMTERWYVGLARATRPVTYSRS